MSDSEDDDWFSKDLDEFVAPKVIGKERENKEISIRNHPYQSLIIENSGGVCPPSSYAKPKSRFENSDKFLSDRLRSLLSKPAHVTALDLFTHLDRWRNTLQDFCELKDTGGLDQCLEILGRVLATPLLELRTQILLTTCQVPLFFNWYLENELIKGVDKGKHQSLAERLMEEIARIIQLGKGHSLDDHFISNYLSRATTPRVNPPPPLLPTLLDFNEEPTHLEAIPIRGQIPDTAHYLTVQMNLLREELLYNLRELIHDIRRQSSGPPKYFSGIKLTPNESFEISIFDAPDSSAATQMYINGSLLLLSTNTHFTDLVLATVTEWTPRNRELRIELLSVENLQLDLFSTPLVMVCCPVFFEPIHRVYHQLLAMHGDPIPFQDVLFQLNKTNQTETVNKGTPAVTTGLYPQQAAAVASGLSQRLTLVQGPPGTGKSRVGQEIIENFLSDGESRILVVSVTNHALDDVLKGLLRTTQSIVRFGTQSKERQLDEFNIKNIHCEKMSSNLLQEGLSIAKSMYMNGLSLADPAEYIHRRQLYLRTVQEIRNIETLFKIQSKRVVGMTTASAARLHILLELYQPHLLVAEEAAEILECHSLAGLTTSLRQMVLIGDHHQLRATLQNPLLATKYHFNVSLFERLIINGMEAVQLDRQGRMRPEFASLLRGVFYDPYESHENVVNLPDCVLGVDKSLFFVDHNHQETVTAGSSKANLFEATYSLHLADYLLKQGYSAADLVILSFYNGHLELIEGRLRDTRFAHLQGVRVRSVDNFQGEEANIVILNAVRSNEEGSIGYVRAKNRICVALSRARFGLFIIGNAQSLRQRSSVWRELLDRLERSGALGQAIPLKCQRHGNLFIEENEQFAFKCLKCDAEREGSEVEFPRDKLPHCS